MSIGPPATLLLAAAAVSAVVHLVADYRGPKWAVYAAKPLTTTLILAAAAVMPAAEPAYWLWVVAGLALSLAGDVFLMLPRDHFVAGLVSFLAAHVAYILAFTRVAPFGSRPLLVIPYVILAGGVLAVLWPRLGKLRLPVVVYVAALVLMAWQAAAMAAAESRPPAFAAAAGAALFVISDATLAINRFRLPFRAAQAVIMSTYVAAQMLIACSVA